MRSWLRLALALTLGTATYLALVVPLEADHQRIGWVLRISAIGIGIACSLQVWAVIDEMFNVRRSRAASEANRMVHQSFIAMYKNKLFKGYATTASIHVWEVPALYRKVFPYRWRRWADENLKGLVSKIPYRPTLRKVVKFRIEDQPMSGIDFKKGVGLVGMCMEENIRERVHSVDFADPAYVAALKGTEEDWSNQSKSITRELTLKQALILSERYRGALAVVIQTPLGEPIGCCTLEVPAESDLDIIKSTQAKADLRRLAQLVEPTLLLKSEKKGSRV